MNYEVKDDKLSSRPSIPLLGDTMSLRYRYRDFEATVTGVTFDDISDQGTSDGTKLNEISVILYLVELHKTQGLLKWDVYWNETLRKWEVIDPS